MGRWVRSPSVAYDWHRDLHLRDAKELGGSPRLPLRQRPIDLTGCFAMVMAGVGLHHAGINGEAVAFNQTSVHAGPYHRFKDLAQEATVPETAVAIDRECRVIRHLVVKVEPTESSIRHVQLDFLAQPPLVANAIAIADDQTFGS
jgi:hypothetical protein